MSEVFAFDAAGGSQPGSVPFIVRDARLWPGVRLTDGRYLFLPSAAWQAEAGATATGKTMPAEEFQAHLNSGYGGWLDGPDFADPVGVERPFAVPDPNLLRRIVEAVAGAPAQPEGAPS